MSNYHCVLDTSALLKKYCHEAGSDLIKDLFNCKDCAIHILNISIPETTGAFVRWRLEGAISEEKRIELLKFFIDDIKDYRVIIHNITHRNIEFTDDVWNCALITKSVQGAQTLISRKCPFCEKGYDEKSGIVEKRVGPMDVLVLSVAKELHRVYKNTILFTSDGHMLNVANKMGLRPFNPATSHKLPF